MKQENALTFRAHYIDRGAICTQIFKGKTPQEIYETLARMGCKILKIKKTNGN
jgi:hypothetical protein